MKEEVEKLEEELQKEVEESEDMKKKGEEFTELLKSLTLPEAKLLAAYRTAEERMESFVVDALNLEKENLLELLKTISLSGLLMGYASSATVSEKLLEVLEKLGNDEVVESWRYATKKVEEDARGSKESKE